MMLLKIIKLYLPFLVGLITGICFYNINVVAPHWAHLPGDMADARFNNYLLEHAYQFMTGEVPSVWSADFLYPEKNVITYSDNLLGSAPFYSLFRIFGFNREISFQYWFILVSALNYVACYFFLFRLSGNNYSAALGAMIFAFSIALQSQMVHAQTFPRYAIPLALLAGVNYLGNLEPKYFFLLLFLLVYQFYCGLYLGFLLFVPVALLLLFSLIFKWRLYRARIKEWKWSVSLAVISIVNLLLLAPLMLPYLQRAQSLETYSYEKILQTVPTLRSHFYSHYGSLFWEFLKSTGVTYEGFWDHQIFAGGVAVLCFFIFAAFILLRMLRKNFFPEIKTDPALTLLFFTGFFTFLFFIRFQGYSLYKVLYPLPGFSSMRALQRIINIELVFYAVAVSFVFNLLFRKENKYSLFIFIFFVGIIYLDNHIQSDTTDRYVKDESDKRINALADKMKLFKEGTIVSYEPDPVSGQMAFYQLDAMLAAQTMKMKTLNGYTANSPVGYSFYWVKPNEENRLRWLKEKNISPDSVVVIH